jgi:hypothetical protein
VKPPDHCKAIPTVYGGVQMRSRMETQCALLFDRLGWKWEYESKSYMLKNGVAYIPDFFIPTLDLIVECRGYESDKGSAQISGFAAEMEAHEIYNYLVIGPDKCTRYIYKQKPREANLTYCCACGVWTFSVQGWIHGACDRCINFTFNELRIEASEGKVRFGGKNSDKWASICLPHRWHLAAFLYRLISHFYDTSGSHHLSNKASAMSFILGRDGLPEKVDCGKCGIPNEEKDFIHRTWDRLLRDEKELKAKNGEQEAVSNGA